MRRRCWFTLFCLWCCTIALCAPGCEKPVAATIDADEALMEKITRVTTSSPRGEIDLPSIAGSEWDQLFVIAPFTPPQDIHQILGFAWPGTAKTKVQHSDTVTLLVFVKDQQVTRWLEYPRIKADFSTVASRSGYKPEQAHFTVRRDDVWPTVELTPATVRSAKTE